MEQLFLIKNNEPELLFFFAGWGMDERPFARIRPAGCDWMICYDYRSPEFDDTLLQAYSRITLIGWSMGVWAATQVMRRFPDLPVTQSIAINGTPYPIDETRGIPPSIFEGTLQGLNEQTLRKFRRRMCGSADEYEAFADVMPQRTAEELKEELESIRRQYDALPAPAFRWRQAVVGTDDRIFPPANQLRAWSGTTDVTQTEAAHYSRSLFENLLTNRQITNVHG
ncbi:DUF452 family protein [Bacteroides pyogenes]|uniref:DUF452 family protein n=1 Tax=Bacteroides pyogenes TaxID=310300 RepID=UPI003B43B588